MKKENSSILIIIRGLPGVGKSTISRKLQKRLIEKKAKVSLIHWDEIFCCVLPEVALNNKIIILTTQMLLSYADNVLQNRKVNIMILDGVFILNEELKLLENFQKKFTKHYFFRIKTNMDEILRRNRNRNEEEYVEEERIKSLSNESIWNNSSINEIIIENNFQEEEKTLNDIVKHIEGFH